MNRPRTFLVLWTLAVAASTTAFITRLALRGRAVDLGFELGKAHGRLGRLREIKRVLELELASYRTPERVELVARTLIGMAPPSVDRILPAGPEPEPGAMGSDSQGVARQSSEEAEQ